MATKLGSLFYQLTLDDKELNAKLTQNNAKVMGFADKMGNLGDKLKGAGQSMTTNFTLPLVAAGGAALKMSTDFNGAMANIATLIPNSTDRVNELKGSIQDLAVDVGKSTADLADGMYQVISAFGDTADSVKILEMNAKAAKAGLAETTDAINLTSAVTKGYGDTSAEAVGKASDLALLTVRLGQTTFPELAASIGRVTPLAASLNVTQEELFGTMATFTGVTGGAAEVSTQLRGVLQSMLAPTDAAAEVFKKMGYESGAAAIEGEGLQGTINALVAEAERTGKPLQDYISSIEGQTLALAATGGQADNYTEKIKAMGKANGTTDKAFKEVTEGVNKTGFEFEQAKAKMEVMAQKAGDALAPALSSISEFLGGIADKFMSLNPEQQKMILIIGGIVAAIGPLLMVLGQVAMGIKAISVAFAFLNANPVVLAVVAIILLIAGLAYLIINNWDTLKQWFGTFVEAVGGFFTGLWDWIKGAFKAGLSWVKQNWQLLLGIVLGPLGILIGLVIKHWDKIKSGIANGINGAVNFVRNGISNIVNFFTSLPSKITGAIGNMGSLLYNKGKDLINGLLNGAGSLLSKIGNFFLDKIPSWIKDPFKKALGIASPSKVFADYGKNTVEGLTQGIARNKGMVEGALDNLGTSVDAQFGMNASVNAGQGENGFAARSDGSPTYVTIEPKGIIARSRSELRDITKDMLSSVDEELTAKGKKPILGGA